MIIPESIRRAFSARKTSYEILQGEMDGLLGRVAWEVGATYSARPPKTDESILDKIQTGEWNNPTTTLEDICGGTIVVPTLNYIPQVRAKVSEVCNVVSEVSDRSRAPEYFGYGDYHLILSVRDSHDWPHKEVLGLRFELQVKTLLQQAWAQVIHDFVYKTQELSWAKARLASEIKGMLELADQALAHPEAAVALLAGPENKDYERLQGFVLLLKTYWTEDRLPKNLRRAALTIQNYVEYAGIRSHDLEPLVAKAAYDQIRETMVISPTQAIFIILFLERKDQLLGSLARRNRRVLVTEEMEDFYPVLKQIPAANRISL